MPEDHEAPGQRSNVRPYAGLKDDPHFQVTSPRIADQCTRIHTSDSEKRQQCHEQTVSFMSALAKLWDAAEPEDDDALDRFEKYQLGHCFCESSADLTHHKCCKCGEMVFDHNREEQP